MATRRAFCGKRLEDLEQICGYFRNNASRMAYDEYLAAGYPIASGMIEGACRNVVSDRMERFGMRWVVYGCAWPDIVAQHSSQWLMGRFHQVSHHKGNTISLSKLNCE